MNHFEKVKHYLLELGYEITTEDHVDEVYVISAPEDGISNLVLDCESPILIIEQFLFPLEKESLEIYKNLLQKNRELVHGAFAIDETGTKVLYRDTLQLENLDLNEIEASLNSLKLLMAEYSTEFLQLIKK